MLTKVTVCNIMFLTTREHHIVTIQYYSINDLNGDCLTENDSLQTALDDVAIHLAEQDDESGEKDVLIWGIDEDGEVVEEKEHLLAFGFDAINPAQQYGTLSHSMQGTHA